MNEIERILNAYCANMTHPVKASEIASSLDLNESNSSCPATRKKIREAIKEGVGIGSSAKGYFLLRTEREMQIYLNSLMQRQIALTRRIAAVNDAFYG